MLWNLFKPLKDLFCLLYAVALDLEEDLPQITIYMLLFLDYFYHVEFFILVIIYVPKFCQL